MEIKKQINGDEITLAIVGRLDTTTAPSLEEELKNITTNILVFDFTNLEYISSAGLRVLLSTHKNQKAKSGKMIVKNINDTIKEVLEMTGLLDLFNVQ